MLRDQRAVKTLIQRLLELIESLQPVPGVDAGALRNLLRAYSAAAIQEDPSQANIPPGPIDPLTEEAIRAGAEQAKALNLEGVRMRLVLEDLPLGTAAADAGEAHAETFGPFALNGGRLLRFAAIR